MTSFLKDESGAVTVDWVLLAAGLVAVAIAATTVIGSGMEAGATDIDETLSTGHIIQTSFTPEAVNTPYSPFDQMTYDAGYSLFTNHANAATLAAENDVLMRRAVDWISNRSQAEAQEALDFMQGAASGAANAGFTTSSVNVDGIDYDTQGLQDLYDSRFPS